MSLSRFPFACPAAASFSPFGNRILHAVMSRDEETTGGKTRTATRAKGPFLYSLRRDEGKKRAEKSNVELRNVGGNVAWYRQYFVTSSPSHPIPRRTTVRISESARRQCFSLVSLTVLLFQRRRRTLAMAENQLDTRISIRFEIKRKEEWKRQEKGSLLTMIVRAKSANPVAKKRILDKFLHRLSIRFWWKSVFKILSFIVLFLSRQRGKKIRRYNGYSETSI